MSRPWWGDRCQRHRRQIFPPISLVVLIPVANLPPVSTMPVANCHRYQRRRRQIIGTISGCSHLKLNLKAKIYIYVNSTTQRCPNKIMKIFQFEDFCHLPPVSATPVVHLELRISPRIFEKIWNGSFGILRGLGETDSWKKNRSRKSRGTVPLMNLAKNNPPSSHETATLLLLM